MRILKYALLALAGLVALVVLAVVVIVATFDPNKYKPELAAVVKVRTGRTLAIEGKLALTIFPSIGVAMGKTSLSEPRGSRVFAGFDEAKVSVALLPLLSRQVVVDRVTLTGLHADLIKRKDGTTNFDDLLGAPGDDGVDRSRPGPKTRPKPGPGEEPPRLDIAGIDIRSSSLSWRNEASGGRFKATIAEFRTGRIASGAPGKLSLAARIEGTQPPLDLGIKLSSGYRLDFEKQKFSLQEIDLKVSNETPGAGPATSAKGAIEIALAPQSIQFDLALDRVNLDRYLGAEKGKAPAAGKAGASPKGAEEPIDLSALKGLNLKGALKVDEFVASNVKMEKLNLGVQAASGKVDLNPLAASLYQGSLAGSASVNASNQRFTMKSQLEGVAIGPLLRDALDNDLLEGRGSVALDLQTEGNTVSAMKKALAGSAKLALRDGALKGINLEEMIRKARELARSKPAPEQKAERTERTDLTELSASFAIKNGIAHNEDLSAKSPLLRLAGSGDVNVPADTIDYVARVTVVRTSGGQGGKEAADLSGVTVPVKITGPLDAPRFRADLRAAASDTAKDRAEEKLKEEKEQLRERARDRLKGLFKR